jgi:hypothetical protein
MCDEYKKSAESLFQLSIGWKGCQKYGEGGKFNQIGADWVIQNGCPGKGSGNFNMKKLEQGGGGAGAL